MPVETAVWDTAEILDSPEMVAAYIDAILEDGDAGLIASALGDIARSKGMTEIAQKTGVTREGLYKALSAAGDPKLSTFIAVLKSLGLRLSVKPLEERAAESDDDSDSLRHAS